MPRKKGASVAYQNKDIFSKMMAEEFCGKSFSAYGIDVPQIVRAEPTNLPEIEASELRMDNLFELADGSYAIVDYESVYCEANKIKYLGYLARILKRLYNQKKKFPQIRMIVIYTANVQPKKTNPVLELGGIRLTLTEAFLSKLNPQEIWEKVFAKVQNGQKLDNQDMMQLMIYPLIFKNRTDQQEALKRAIDLADKIKDGRMTTFVLKGLDNM